MNHNDLVRVIENKSENYKPIIGHSFLKGIYYYSDDCIIKELNSEKISRLYKGDYSSLANGYHRILNKLLSAIDVYECFQYKNTFFEVSSRIDERKFFEAHNIFSWEEYKMVFLKVLRYIDNIDKYNKNSNIKLGLDSSIWNFTADGVNFDFSPPRLLSENNNSLFVRDDIEHYKRTYYRCFDSDGMRSNLLATAFSIIDDGEIIIDLPCDWKQQLYDIYCMKIQSDTLLILNENGEFHAPFAKHPIKIIRRKMNFE